MDLDAIVAAVKAHAESAQPFECCGLIDSTGKVIPCTNAAGNRTTNFLINPSDFKRASRSATIAGVYHSHVESGAYISNEDRDGIAFEGLYIVAGIRNRVVCEVKIYFRSKDFVLVEDRKL